MRISRKKLSNSLGFTLIEMIIGLALSVLVMTAIIGFFRNTARTQAMKASRSAAMKWNKSLIELVKRDFRFQTAFTVGSDGKSLDLTRRRLYQKNIANGTYNIQFASQCVKIDSSHAGTKAILLKAYAGQNAGIFAQTPSQCISSMKCPIGEMPQVKLLAAATGADIPIYSQTEFPRISAELKEQPLGMGLCFQTIQTKVRVIVESAWLADSSNATLAVLSDEILLSPSEFSNVDIIPGNANSP